MTMDNCPKCGRSFDDGRGYRLETSVEIRGIYDGTAFWADDPYNGGCGWAWHRFPKDDTYWGNLHSRIQPHLDSYINKNYHI